MKIYIGIDMAKDKFDYCAMDDALNILCRGSNKENKNERVQGLTHVYISHAGDSVGPFIRTVQASSSFENLFSVNAGFSYFHFFPSLSIANIILMSFLMVDTCANFPEPFLFFTES